MNKLNTYISSQAIEITDNSESRFISIIKSKVGIALTALGILTTPLACSAPQEQRWETQPNYKNYCNFGPYRMEIGDSWYEYGSDNQFYCNVDRSVTARSQNRRLDSCAWEIAETSSATEYVDKGRSIIRDVRYAKDNVFEVEMDCENDGTFTVKHVRR